MIDFHPALTCFPIALILFSTGVEFLGFATKREIFLEVGRVVLFGAAALTPLTYYSGYLASEQLFATQFGQTELIEKHQAAALLFLLLLFAAVILCRVAQIAKFGKPYFIWAYRVSLLSCCCCIIYVGYLGGTLVFRHGAGVTTSATKS